MKPENLMFGHLGSGVTVFDGNRLKNSDYLTVAHISYQREIKYYTRDLSDEAKNQIENFAGFGNMAVSVCQPDAYALCPLIL
jgi:hypothetical protein